MIHVFCNKRGSGKTKALIDMANERAAKNNGHIVYIDDDKMPMLQLDKSIRFVDTSEFDLKNGESFYGLVCGIISEDYDIDTIFIDGLLNIVNVAEDESAHLFSVLEKITDKNNIEMFININEEEGIPEFIKKYVA